MSPTDADDTDPAAIELPPSIGPEVVDYGSYAAVDLEDGAVIVYDRREVDAWVQSDAAISVAAVR